MDTAVCNTDEFSNFTQYKGYQIIDSTDSKLKIIDDDGDVCWVDPIFFYVR